MMHLEHIAELYRKSVTQNAYGEPVAAWNDEGSIRVAISELTNSLQQINNVNRVESTHSAVCYAGGVSVGDRIVDDGIIFDVLSVTQGRRFQLLQLKQSEANVL